MRRLFDKLKAAAFIVPLVLLSTGLVRAEAVTVQEVARELECPCDCPLVLEDCNMSCGLEWKGEIGEAIRAGKTKQEIVQDFIDRYGDACRITPIKRIKGKLYQYTRGFDTVDWVIFWGGVGAWVAVLFAGVFLVARKLVNRKGRGGEKEGGGS
ncbi:MAG: cytochrome c-type biogenesis protein CcmH [Thermodesulfobacteriota bacterium]